MTEQIIEAKRGEIYWVNFSPTIGTEIRKIRPALIIFSSTKRFIALPITSKTQEIKERQLVVKKLVKDKDGKILIDQIRAFDKQRLLRKLGVINNEEMKKVNQMLREMLIIE